MFTPDELDLLSSHAESGDLQPIRALYDLLEERGSPLAAVFGRAAQIHQKIGGDGHWGFSSMPGNGHFRPGYAPMYTHPLTAKADRLNGSVVTRSHIVHFQTPITKKESAALDALPNPPQRLIRQRSTHPTPDGMGILTQHPSQFARESSKLNDDELSLLRAGSFEAFADKLQENEHPAGVLVAKAVQANPIQHRTWTQREYSPDTGSMTMRRFGTNPNSWSAHVLLPEGVHHIFYAHHDEPEQLARPTDTISQVAHHVQQALGSDAGRALSSLANRALASPNRAKGSWHQLADGRVGLLTVDHRTPVPLWHFSVHADKAAGLRHIRTTLGAENALRASQTREHPAGEQIRNPESKPVAPVAPPAPKAGLVSRAIDGIDRVVSHRLSPFNWIAHGLDKINQFARPLSGADATHAAVEATKKTTALSLPFASSTGVEHTAFRAVKSATNSGNNAFNERRIGGDAQGIQHSHKDAARAHLEAVKALTGLDFPEARQAHLDAGRAHLLAASTHDFDPDVEKPAGDAHRLGRDAARDSLRWLKSINPMKAETHDIGIDAHNEMTDAHRAANNITTRPNYRVPVRSIKDRVRNALTSAADGDFRSAMHHHQDVQTFIGNAPADMGDAKLRLAAHQSHRKAVAAFGKLAGAQQFARTKPTDRLFTPEEESLLAAHGETKDRSHLLALYDSLAERGSPLRYLVGRAAHHEANSVDDNPFRYGMSVSSNFLDTEESTPRLAAYRQRADGRYPVTLGHPAGVGKHAFFRAALPEQEARELFKVHQPQRYTWGDFPKYAPPATTDESHQFARPVQGVAGAVQSVLSDQQRVRRMLAQRIATEARLTLAGVQNVIVAGAGAKTRASLAQHVAHENEPNAVTFAAAWYGLLAREPRLLVFHEHDDGTGPDKLNVWKTAASPADQHTLAAQLGVQHLAAGTDGVSYAFGPKGSDPTAIQRLIRGTNATDSSIVRGTAHLIGAGSGSGADARSAYRSVIRAAQGD